MSKEPAAQVSKDMVESAIKKKGHTHWPTPGRQGDQTGLEEHEKQQ